MLTTATLEETDTSVSESSKISKSHQSKFIKVICDSARGRVNCKHGAAITQKEFNDQIADYFLNKMVPLHIIDEPHFRQMFQCLNIEQLELELMTRAGLENYIDDVYSNVISDIKMQLKDIKDVCIISYYDQFIFKSDWVVTTCHWITSDLKRKSCILSAWPFYGNKSEHYRINRENLTLLAGIDDVKNLTTKETYDISKNNDIPTSTKSVYCRGIIATIYDLMSASEEINSHPCVIHVLEDLFSRSPRNDLGWDLYRKCSKFTEVSDNPESAEIMKNIIGYVIPKTKDNFYIIEEYKLLQNILTIQEKCNELNTALNISDPLDKNDFIKIKEFSKCFEPIAEAVGALHNENEFFYGITLPCLLSLRKKMVKLTNENYNYVYFKDLPSQYLSKIEQRFANNFDLSTESDLNAAIAAISHPQFKNKWFSCMDATYHNKVKAAFKEAIVKEMANTLDTDTRGIEPFFNFNNELNNKEKNEVGQSSQAEKIMNLYLCDIGTDLSMLYRHKEVKAVFIKYNTGASARKIFDSAFMRDIVKYADVVTPAHDLLGKIVVIKCNMDKYRVELNE